MNALLIIATIQLFIIVAGSAFVGKHVKDENYILAGMWIGIILINLVGFAINAAYEKFT